MAEVNGDFSGGLHGGAVDDFCSLHDWERGLPNADDITPLSQGLIPPELLSAFNIKPEPYRTALDVTQASEDTISSLRGSNLAAVDAGEEVVDFADDDEMSESKKPRRNDSPEDADSEAGDKAAAAAKRTRLVWTPQLHRRFVDVVAHLGIKNAVPKTIMQLMNVEGLTRENVASHLQKYRLYLKRMGGVSFDGGPSNSNSSSPAPAQENGGGDVSVPVPVPAPMMMMQGHFNRYEARNHNNYNYSAYYQNSGNHSSHNNSNGMMQSGGNNYGVMMPYHHQQHTNNHPHVGDHN